LQQKVTHERKLAVLKKHSCQSEFACFFRRNFCGMSHNQLI